MTASFRCLMIDVDHFKLYNDTYGHPEGDACLTRLGETLSGIAAETMGFAGRYGGEEFCLLLPNVDADARARDRRDGARRRPEPGAAAPRPRATSMSPSASASPATRPNDMQRPGDLIEAADAALYAAKHRGRNTVVEHGFVRADDAAAVSRWRVEPARLQLECQNWGKGLVTRANSQTDLPDVASSSKFPSSPLW